MDLAYLAEDGVPDGVLGDVTRLRQIVVNLAGNAVKFTEKGEVVVEVRGVKAGTGEAAHSLELHFAVRDTGIGIPPDKQDRLFKSFSQVDSSTTRQFGGTGLGLAISKRLAELMGGRMWVESEAGRGSIFHFTIQVKRGETPAEAASSSVLTGKRLLVVEDFAVNRRFIEQAARGWGMTARGVASADAALSLLRAGESFDLVVIDWQLPDAEGWQVVENIRRLPGLSALPVVAMSSVRMRAGDSRMREAGVSVCVSKPLRCGPLRDALERAVGGHAQSRKAPTVSEIDKTLAERLPLRILLADDNRVNQKVGAAFLQKMGYRVELAGNGVEVLQNSTVM